VSALCIVDGVLCRDEGWGLTDHVTDKCWVQAVHGVCGLIRVVQLPSR
jgi:hypothetical protein